MQLRNNYNYSRLNRSIYVYKIETLNVKSKPNTKHIPETATADSTSFALTLAYLFLQVK